MIAVQAQLRQKIQSIHSLQKPLTLNPTLSLSASLVCTSQLLSGELEELLLVSRPPPFSWRLPPNDEINFSSNKSVQPKALTSEVLAYKLNIYKHIQ